MGTTTQILKDQNVSKLTEVLAGKKWWGLWKEVVVCGSDGGMRKCTWAPEQNLVKVRREMGRWMEMLLSGDGFPGWRADVG